MRLLPRLVWWLGSLSVVALPSACAMMSPFATNAPPPPRPITDGPCAAERNAYEQANYKATWTTGENPEDYAEMNRAKARADACEQAEQDRKMKEEEKAERAKREEADRQRAAADAEAARQRSTEEQRAAAQAPAAEDSQDARPAADEAQQREIYSAVVCLYLRGRSDAHGVTVTTRVAPGTYVSHDLSASDMAKGAKSLARKARARAADDGVKLLPCGDKIVKHLTACLYSLTHPVAAPAYCDGLSDSVDAAQNLSNDILTSDD